MDPYQSEEAILRQVFHLSMGLTIFFAVLLLGVFYLFEALALYRLSKNRGYQRPWIAFLPVVNAWVLGGIADNIQCCFGKTTRWRVILLTAEVVWSIIYVADMAVMFLSVFPEMMRAAMTGSVDAYSLFSSPGWTQFAMISPLVQLFSLAHLAVKGIVCYRVYHDYAPGNAVLFTVFSVLFGLWPFFLFALRNRLSASLYWKNQPRPPYPPAPYGMPPVPPHGPEGGGNPPLPPRP